MTGIEAWRRRLPVESTQPDSIVGSIGYPITDSVYGSQRSIDFQPVTPGEPAPPIPGVRQGADDFINFIEGTLRPFIRSEFPKVQFSRDAVYGHSFGGLFVVYALLRRPDLFDTFLSASPALYWNDGYILDHTSWLDEAPLLGNATKPAFRLAYGDLEQYPGLHLNSLYNEDEDMEEPNHFTAPVERGPNWPGQPQWELRKRAAAEALENERRAGPDLIEL
ncbi:hypothetical protein DL770_010459 [Monosporascus sp. CRB-9-2]|nr:hypothetical protein DL770_010459 [Monosporascus sp. CRB-9-2]